MKPAPTAKTQTSELSTPEGWEDDDLEMLEEYDFSNGRPNPYCARYAANPKHHKPGIRFVTDSVGRKVGVLLNLSHHKEVWEEYSKGFDLSEFQFLGTRSGDYHEVLLEFDRHLDLWQTIFDAIVLPYQP
ncbi:MAG: hypothetical protein ACO33Y_09345 [Burkholderiaceae bacterium]